MSHRKIFCISRSSHLTFTSRFHVTLSNSIRGMHQTHARRIYIGAILPIATYGLGTFWKSKSGRILNTMTLMQNKCLRMITGAFRTTNISALEIEASIPPIELWMDYRLDMEALRIARLPEDHAILHRIYPDQRDEDSPPAEPPLPAYNPSRSYRCNPREKFSTCITRISARTLANTERTKLNPEGRMGRPAH